MAKTWIKLYIEILNDPKMGKLGDHLWRRVIECFLVAGEFDDDGRLPPLEDTAWRLHQTEESMAEQLEYLTKLGIISKDAKGYFVTNYAKRQAPVSGAQRVRDHRRRQDVMKRYTDSNESVTKNDRVQSTESTTTGATGNKAKAIMELTTFARNHIDKKLSDRTGQRIKKIVAAYDPADVLYAIDEAERLSTSTDDKCNFAYVEAICKRRSGDDAPAANGQHPAEGDDDQAALEAIAQIIRFDLGGDGDAARRARAIYYEHPDWSHQDIAQAAIGASDA